MPAGAGDIVGSLAMTLYNQSLASSQRMSPGPAGGAAAPLEPKPESAAPAPGAPVPGKGTKLDRLA